MDVTSRRPRRRAAVTALVALAALVAAASVHARLAPGPEQSHGAALSAGEEVPTPAVRATRFRTATFNVLGAGHTEPSDNTKYEDGVTRMRYTVRLIRELYLSVVGVQELRRVQWEEFNRLTGTDYDTWPGDAYAEAAMQNSIIWKRDRWDAVRKETIRIPYFDGNMIRMPYLLLRDRVTGQLVWFANFHNPADAHGDAEKWRDQATELEIDLVNRLQRDHPGVPVFLMGDFNEREEVFRKVLTRTDLEAANGGGRRADGTWQYPKPMKVDWVFGPRTAMTGYRALRTPLVQKASDHPLVMTDVSIPPSTVQASPVDRVVVVSVAGLSSRPFFAMPASSIPGYARLRREGASTLNARTTVERTTQLPNDLSMLTGRRVAAYHGGHGVLPDHDPGGTVHQLAGRYASSVLDLVSNFGGSTAVFTQRNSVGLVDRSWDAETGGADPYGLDDGRDKLDVFVREGDSGRLGDRLVDYLSGSPRTFTFVQLADPDSAGQRHGFTSDEWEAAVQRTDVLLQRILYRLWRNESTRGRTLLVVVGSHGGTGRDHKDATRLGNARVPFLVWGPGVAAGGDLYQLNPHYTDPGVQVPTGYDGGQPVRTVHVANLALTALRLPSVPGSPFNDDQDLNVFAGQ